MTKKRKIWRHHSFYASLRDPKISLIHICRWGRWQGVGFSSRSRHLNSGVHLPVCTHISSQSAINTSSTTYRASYPEYEYYFRGIQTRLYIPPTVLSRSLGSCRAVMKCYASLSMHVLRLTHLRNIRTKKHGHTFEMQRPALRHLVTMTIEDLLRTSWRISHSINETRSKRLQNIYHQN